MVVLSWMGNNTNQSPFFTPNPDTSAGTKTSGCENTLIDPCSLRKHKHIVIITFYSLLQHLIRIPLWLNWHGTFLIAADSLQNTESCCCAWSHTHGVLSKGLSPPFGCYLGQAGLQKHLGTIKIDAVSTHTRKDALTAASTQRVGASLRSFPRANSLN